MVQTRGSRAKSLFESDGWTADITMALLAIVSEWAMAVGKINTTDEWIVRYMCHNKWSDRLFGLTNVRKTGDEIVSKLQQMHFLFTEMQRLLSLLPDGMVRANGRPVVPPNWSMPNEPPSFVYLRTYGLPDYEELCNIFGRRRLAIYPVGQGGGQDDPIVVNDGDDDDDDEAPLAMSFILR